MSNEHTRRAYRRALEKFLAWYDARGYAEISRQVLFDYRTWSEASGAAPSSTNVELAAVGFGNGLDTLWRRWHFSGRYSNSNLAEA